MLGVNRLQCLLGTSVTLFTVVSGCSHSGSPNFWTQKLSYVKQASGHLFSQRYTTAISAPHLGEVDPAWSGLRVCLHPSRKV